jgi:hypothetical protein
MQAARHIAQQWMLYAGFGCALTGCGSAADPANGGAQMDINDISIPPQNDLVACTEPVGAGFPDLAEMTCGDEPGSTNDPFCNLAWPVCGEDGTDYFNPYFACQQVARYAVGPCRGIVRCPTSVEPDAFCPAIYQPVCGENGETYPNACEACKVVERYDKGGVCRGSIFERP